MIGSIVAGQVSDLVLQWLRKKSPGGKVIPEMRLRAAIPSFFLIPAGYLIYAWTTEYATGVYAPIIGLFVCMSPFFFYYYHYYYCCCITDSCKPFFLLLSLLLLMLLLLLLLPCR